MKRYYDTIKGEAINLPTHIERDGFMLPLKNAKGEIKNLATAGILELIPATPDKDKIIIESHAELIASGWTEIIDVQRTIAQQAEIELAAKINNLKIIVAGDVIDALTSFNLPIEEGHEADPITELLLQNPLFFVYAERLNLTDLRLIPIMIQVDEALQQMSNYSVYDIKKYIVEK